MRGLPSTLIAVTYGALLIAVWGFISLLTDVDVIAERDAGPVLGPAMALSAIAVTYVAVVRVRKTGARALTAVLATASVFMAMLLLGGLGYAIARGELSWTLLFAAKYALSPFVIAAAVLAGVVVALVTPFAPPAPEG